VFLVFDAHTACPFSILPPTLLTYPVIAGIQKHKIGEEINPVSIFNGQSPEGGRRKEAVVAHDRCGACFFLSYSSHIGQQNKNHKHIQSSITTMHVTEKDGLVSFFLCHLLFMVLVPLLLPVLSTFSLFSITTCVSGELCSRFSHFYFTIWRNNRRKPR
jgi:hypothetical protein